MKSLLKLTAGASLILLVFVSAVSAVSAADAPAGAKPGSTLEQRVEQRKQERAISLDEKDQKRLISTCISGQSKMRIIQASLVPVMANRTKVYQNIDAKLFVTIGQLKLAEKDTFKLEKGRVELEEKTVQFQTLADNFKQTLDDTVIINCKADPVGFKALLETVRLYYAELQKQSVINRDFVINNIKPELVTQTTDLQAKTVTPGSN